MKIDKKQCQTWHCVKRAKERLGIALTERDISEIVNSAIDEKPSDRFKLTFVEAQSNRVSVFKLEFDSISINCVIDIHRRSIVTFLFDSKEIKTIYHYYDIFNNKINVSTITKKFWSFNTETNELIIPFEEVLTVGNQYIVQPMNKVFEFDNGDLIEVIP